MGKIIDLNGENLVDFENKFYRVFVSLYKKDYFNLRKVLKDKLKEWKSQGEKIKLSSVKSYLSGFYFTLFFKFVHQH